MKLTLARDILKSYDENDQDFDFGKFETVLRKSSKPSKQRTAIGLQEFYAPVLLDSLNSKIRYIYLPYRLIFLDISAHIILPL